MRRDLSRMFYRWLGYGKVVFGAAAGAVSATLKTEHAVVEKYLGTYVASGVDLLRDFAWFLVPIFLVLTAIFGYAAKRLGDPVMWDLLQDLIDELRNKVFSDAGSEYQHHHRVTLFQHVRWKLTLRCWPWSGWLFPVVRSGHTTQVSKVCFRAPSDADQSEGVAGRAWCVSGALKISDLPAVGATSSAESLADYASKTGVSVAWLQSYPRQPGRSFFAFRVLAKGKPWGVIVIDSRKETMPFKKATAGMTSVGDYMSHVLARVLQ